MLPALERWLALLEARSGEHRVEFGLERVEAVWQRLWGERAFPARVITVAGTNGKGSTVAFIEAIALAAGLRVGAYTSPHLLRYNERIRVGGELIGDEALVAAFEVVEKARGLVPLTYFEFSTLAALWHFACNALDLLVLEVGMGGRLDAVNLIDPDVAVITPVALDHQEFLGETREEIGREKAGIMRAGIPVVLSDPDPPRSVLDTAAELGARSYRLGVEFGYEVEDRHAWRMWARGFGVRAGLPYPALRGVGQLANASAAIMALMASGVVLPQQAVREGLLSVRLPGRFQVLAGAPRIVLDVAHNPHAAAALAENLAQLASEGEAVHALFGCFADKDAVGIVEALQEQVASWTLVSTPGIRGQSAQALADRVRLSCGVEPVACVASVQEGLERLIKVCDPRDIIAVFGSFTLVGQALSWHQNAKAR